MKFKDRLRNLASRIGTILNKIVPCSFARKLIGFYLTDFRRISLPLIKRIYPKLIAEQIVNAQPMTAPTGLIFYLRYRYSSNNENKNEN